MTRFGRIAAAALTGAVLLFASAAVAQVPGGVGIKPPFVNGDCVKASGPGVISTTGAPCSGGSGTVTSVNASGGTTGLSFTGGPITTSGTLTLGGGLVVANGGTGNTSYTDGQLLIGNTATGGLSKATLTAGTNVTITNGNGTITIAASGGGGSGCTTTGTGLVLSSDGAAGCTSNADFRYSAGTATLGTAGSVVGQLALQNATSGTLTIAPPTGALGTVTVTVPAATDTLVNLAGSQALTNKSLSTFSGALNFAPANANFTASPTGTGTVTINPATAGTMDNVNVGATTAGTGRFSTLTATGAVTLSPASVAVAISPTGTGTVAISPAGALTINPTAASTINNASIGATTASTGRFTTLTTTGAVTLSPANASVTASPTGTGTVTINPATAGTINNMSIGQTTKAAGSFTTIVGTSSATLGVAAGTTGSVVLNGTTSGAVTITPQGAAGTYNFNLPTAAGTSGQPLLSGGGGTTAMSFGTLGVAAGGTGQTSYTDGQLLIGNTTGNTLAKSTLTAGSGISITNGAGSITIAATGAASAPQVKTASFNVTAGDTYCAATTTAAGTVTATLPASPANGDTVAFWDCQQSFATYNLVLARNGNTIMNSATDLTVNTNNANFHATYVSNGGITTWILW